MEIGRCALCLRDGVELQESHYVSAGVYRIVGRGGGPVVMTPELFVSTSKQVRDHLLCRDCEQAFSKKGEDYVIRLLAQGQNNFPLLELLKAVKPLGRGQSGSLVFSGSQVGIDTDKLAYYALSMFWRASIHSWKTLNGQFTSGSLRAYEEQIRKFLNGESGFPAGVVIKVSVCTDPLSQGSVFPPVEWSNDVYTGYEMTVLGIRFTMVVGVQPGAKEWDLCCVNSKDRLIFLEDCEETSRDHYLDLRKNARIAQNLVK